MLARLLRADNPSIALDELPPAAAAAMVRRWCPSLASDLILAEAAATQLAAAASVHEASALLLREAQANGLSGRHACRLALEAVLIRTSTYLV